MCMYVCDVREIFLGKNKINNEVKKEKQDIYMYFQVVHSAKFKLFKHTHIHI